MRAIEFTETEHRSGIDVEEHEDVEDPSSLWIIASSHGRELGHVKFYRSGNNVTALDLEVKPEYRGQGIARIMYDYAKEQGYKVLRSSEQTDAGYQFWEKHKPRQGVWEQEIVEYRGGSWREIRKWVPQHWPDYVVKDWLYKRISDKIGLDDRKEHVQFMLSTYPVKQWKLETRKFTLDSFEEFTKTQLLLRKGGDANPHNVPKDKERHKIQQQRIQRTGEASQEPIVCIQRPGVSGLELIEGWHRTTQNIKAFPDGWKGRAWVGYI